MRCLLISPKPQALWARPLQDLGTALEHEVELYTGLAAAMDDPRGYDVVLLDCDPFGGAALGLAKFHQLRAAAVQAAIVLISAAHQAQSFPDTRHAAILLRGPGSDIGLRIALDHAMQERKIWQAA